MGDRAAEPTPPSVSPPTWRQRLGWTRYLLIVPIYWWYRRRVNEQLKWRLASSHISVVLLSVALISVLGAAAIVLIAIIGAPAAEEPGRDARQVAQLVQEAESEQVISDEDLSGLLSSIRAGLIEPSRSSGALRLRLDFPGAFEYLDTVSIVDRDNNVISSSDPDLTGRNVIQIGVDSYFVSRLAFRGDATLRETSVVRPDAGVITGAYPLRDENGEITRVVVVTKSATAVPHGIDMLSTALLAMGQIGVLLAIFVAIPAIPVAIITGFRRAESISEPVTNLAEAAGKVASGDLSARVEVLGEDEIASLEEEFNQMADQLELAIDEQRTHREQAEGLLAANRSLVSSVSHELRTPVAVVRGHLEALLADPAQTENYARIALRETDRLERLVDDLFQLTRIESKGMQIANQPFDAGAAAREAVESLQEPTRREAGITMICETPDIQLMVMGDRARIVQVLQNLIRNAIRHTPEGGIILVSAEREPDGEIVLQVFDTGEGITPDHLPHIFDRFYRADPSRTHSGGAGAGLGLAIAKELVTLMGGTITVESEPGEGAEFSIRLKAAPSSEVSQNPA
jgi:signal transduction histidine kinase